MDVFDHSTVRPILEKLRDVNQPAENLRRVLHRLRFMALSADGARKIAVEEIDTFSGDGKPDNAKSTGIKVIVDILKNKDSKVKQSSANCLCQLAKYSKQFHFLPYKLTCRL
ncbi:hypothetical protein PILCRDRAFT_750221 [Piloderma croceum F 1598]|uniref:Uncharacterized protein n=1 Tax=Piloderma croceum (strain F 1598) TaxID=765440 RepID=A0A0C3EV78_PILCF|nr:hypothetical protein PILCRDRAFT_750221 [Piloderma croceum F 1598]